MVRRTAHPTKTGIPYPDTRFWTLVRMQQVPPLPKTKTIQPDHYPTDHYPTDRNLKVRHTLAGSLSDVKVFQTRMPDHLETRVGHEFNDQLIYAACRCFTCREQSLTVR